VGCQPGGYESDQTIADPAGTDTESSDSAEEPEGTTTPAPDTDGDAATQPIAESPRAGAAEDELDRALDAPRINTLQE
jgi:hypothetical protein